MNMQSLAISMKLSWSTFKEMNTPDAWRARIARNKWVLAWCGFALLFVFMVGGSCIFWDRPWLGNFLSVFGTNISLYAAILIYLQSKVAGDKATREQLDHMQRLNQTEVEVMTTLFQKQIDAIAENTNRQISEYARETTKVVSKLSENSLFLAELLKRELEDAITMNNSNLEHAEQGLRKAMSWQLGRTPLEREQQIAKHHGILQRLRAWGEYIHRKYTNLTAIFRDSL
jgi:hypothetical protein